MKKKTLSQIDNYKKKKEEAIKTASFVVCVNGFPNGKQLFLLCPGKKKERIKGGIVIELF